MGRYRAPQPPSSKYITPAGKKDLEMELDQLWRVRRPEVTRALTAAAAEGDRSENAEYIYRKKELREIDSRVRYLRKRLDGINVVARVPEEQDRVYFGAWVELIDDKANTVTRTYRIVGPDEFNASEGYISMDSPLGKALLKKHQGDEILVDLPEGNAVYTLLKVWYESESPEEA